MQKRNFWAILAVFWCFAPFHLLPAFAMQKITMDEWNIEDLPGRRLEGSHLYFEKMVFFVSRPLVFDLYRNKLITVIFQELEGVFLLKIEIQRMLGGRTKKLTRIAPVSPKKGPRTIRFDFTDNPSITGLGKKITIKLYGKLEGSQATLPELLIEPATISKRLAIFAEKWMNPVQLNGLVVNLFHWPDFWRIPATQVIGAFWFLGLAVLILLGRFIRRIDLPKTLIVWSLAVWVGVDITQKWVGVSSIGRVKAMRGHFSDSLGFIDSEANFLVSLLKKNRINQVNVFGSDPEKMYLRYVLFPIRVELKKQTNYAIVRGAPDKYIVEDGKLKIGDLVVLKDSAIVGNTDLFTVYSGKPL